MEKRLKTSVKGVICTSGNEVNGEDYKRMLKNVKVDVKEEYEFN